MYRHYDSQVVSKRQYNDSSHSSPLHHTSTKHNSSSHLGAVTLYNHSNERFSDLYPKTNQHRHCSLNLNSGNMNLNYPLDRHFMEPFQNAHTKSLYPRQRTLSRYSSNLDRGSYSYQTPKLTESTLTYDEESHGSHKFGWCITQMSKWHVTLLSGWANTHMIDCYFSLFTEAPIKYFNTKHVTHKFTLNAPRRKFDGGSIFDEKDRFRNEWTGAPSLCEAFVQPCTTETRLGTQYRDGRKEASFFNTPLSNVTDLNSPEVKQSSNSNIERRIKEITDEFDHELSENSSNYLQIVSLAIHSNNRHLAYENSCREPIAPKSSTNSGQAKPLKKQTNSLHRFEAYNLPDNARGLTSILHNSSLENEHRRTLVLRSRTRSMITDSYKRKPESLPLSSKAENTHLGSYNYNLQSLHPVYELNSNSGHLPYSDKMEFLYMNNTLHKNNVNASNVEVNLNSVIGEKRTLDQESRNRPPLPLTLASKPRDTNIEDLRVRPLGMPSSLPRGSAIPSEGKNKNQRFSSSTWRDAVSNALREGMSTNWPSSASNTSSSTLTMNPYGETRTVAPSDGKGSGVAREGQFSTLKDEVYLTLTAVYSMGVRVTRAIMGRQLEVIRSP
uniref:Uncharacterized protein n=1 Tax=Biomphalaria glabrata TaxID=6526 RepID=A0A2C9L9H7_BIOGL